MPHPLLVGLSLALAALSIGYWALVVTRGERRFRAWVTHRFDVAITTGARGTWRAWGKGSRIRLLGIEMLQLAYFIAAFLVWSMLLLISVGVLSLYD